MGLLFLTEGEEQAVLDPGHIVTLGNSNGWVTTQEKLVTHQLKHLKCLALVTWSFEFSLFVYMFMKQPDDWLT